MDIWGLLINSVKEYGISSLITIIATVFATKQYYKKNRKDVVACILDLGIRSMFDIHYLSPLPYTAKAIFVENGKSSFFMLPEQFNETGCQKRGIFDLRTTIATVGNFDQDVHAWRHKKWGVLGLAYELKKPVLFDFREGKLFVFSSGEITEKPVEKKEGNYYYKDHKLSRIEGNTRSIMIAVPIIRNYIGSKRLGGVTFDFAPNENTIYQKLSDRDSEDERKRKNDQNKRVFESAMSTAEYLKIAYFSTKGEK